MNEPKVFFKITRSDVNGYYIAPNVEGIPQGLDGELDALSAEDVKAQPFTVTIEPIVMTQAEYDALPEFDGW